MSASPASSPTDPLRAALNDAEDRLRAQHWIHRHEGLRRAAGSAGTGAGQGGYDEDHEFYGYRTPI